jgi:hypothetical protein
LQSSPSCKSSNIRWHMQTAGCQISQWALGNHPINILCLMKPCRW